jgi:hypothetical protein
MKVMFNSPELVSILSFSKPAAAPATIANPKIRAKTGTSIFSILQPPFRFMFPSQQV